MLVKFFRSGGPHEEVRASRTPSTREELTANGGSAGFIDLDEGVHGAYAATKALYAASHDGPAAMWETLAREGKNLSASPVSWSCAQATPTGVSDVFVSMGVSTLVAPLAVLAIKAGFDETSESISLRRELRQERGVIEQTLEDLKIISGTDRSEAGKPVSALALVTAKRCAETQSLAAVKAAIRHNRYDLGIGVNSLASGTSIFFKALEEIALQSTLLGMAKGANLAALVAGSTALQGVTAVAGIAGTVVLGPATAIFAVGLGACFYGQTREVRKNIQADGRRLIQAMSAGNGSGQVFLNFVTHKLARREEFAKKFERWNLGFLTGSSIYAISVTVKATLFVSAAVGLGILASNPYVLPIVLGVLIVGSVVMVASSTQFLVAHGRSKRHQSYTRQEVPLLSRELDALQQAMHERTPVTGSGSVEGDENSTLRSAYYQFASKQDIARQRFLGCIARETQKFYAWEARATDDAKDRGLPVNSKLRIKDWFARLSGAVAYLQAWFKGEHAEASARRRYGQSANRLTSAAVEDWLSSIDMPGRLDTQREWLTRILREEHAFLEVKLRVCHELVGSDFVDAESDGLDERPRSIFEKLRSEMRTDRERQVLLDNLLLAATPTDDEVFTAPKLRVLKQLFLQLRTDHRATSSEEDDADTLNRKLAEYLTVGMSAELTATRGVLFDMHRQSLRLREQRGSSPQLDRRVGQKEMQE